jgi:uncharacterized protein YciI
MNTKNAADLFAAIVTFATDAAGDWEATDGDEHSGAVDGASYAMRIAEAAEGHNLAAVKALNDEGCMVLGGPVMHIEASNTLRALDALVAADAELAEAVEAFGNCDDEDDEEIADARAAVLDAARAASPDARKRAHGELGWDGLRA